MINVDNLSRGVINKRVNRMKRIFRWAVSKELIPNKFYEGLRTVSGLRKGGTKAREIDPVKPIRDEHVQAVLPFVAAQVATMVQLQTGMRPSEVVLIRKCDIDLSGEIWIPPTEHKNTWMDTPLLLRELRLIDEQLCDLFALLNSVRMSRQYNPLLTTTFPRNPN